jgi:hypothetical protein
MLLRVMSLVLFLFFCFIRVVGHVGQVDKAGHTTNW